MPRKGKAQQAKEDAAWLASMQPELPMPTNKQILSTDRHETVPPICPRCEKAMAYASGWALIFGDFLQCGRCGHVIAVPRAEYERYAKGLHDHFDRLKSQPKPTRGPKTRGAG